MITPAVVCLNLGGGHASSQSHVHRDFDELELSSVTSVASRDARSLGRSSTRLMEEDEESLMGSLEDPMDFESLNENPVGLDYSKKHNNGQDADKSSEGSSSRFSTENEGDAGGGATMVVQRRIDDGEDESMASEDGVELGPPKPFARVIPDSFVGRASEQHTVSSSAVSKAGDPATLGHFLRMIGNERNTWMELVYAPDALLSIAMSIREIVGNKEEKTEQDVEIMKSYGTLRNQLSYEDILRLFLRVITDVGQS